MVRQVSLYSKSQISFGGKFTDIVESLKTFKAPMVLDGKIISKKGQNIFYVFDILYFNGVDLRAIPLQKRKAILKTAFSQTKNIQQVEVIKVPKEGDIVLAKRKDSTYHGGVTSDWLKITYEPENLLVESSVKPAPTKIKKPAPVNKSLQSNKPILTHLGSIFWPKEKVTKGDLIEYYRKVSQYILPYLIDRPESLNRQPNGIEAPGFYQKDLTGYHPRWLKTKRIFSESADKSIDYVMCQDERSLLYIVNLGCVEINPWFSRIQNLDYPDFLVLI